jgi:hypothetical protein
MLFHKGLRKCQLADSFRGGGNGEIIEWFEGSLVKIPHRLVTYFAPLQVRS